MNTKYAMDNATLLAAVTAEMQRLTTADTRGRAPSRAVWDVRREKHLPCANYLIQRFGVGWPAVVEMADGTPARKWQRRDGSIGGVVAQATGLAADIERHMANGAELASHNSRYHAALHVLPAPTRRETVAGRTLAGQPVVIERTYWMVR
jgi:hypothetical protein